MKYLLFIVSIVFITGCGNDKAVWSSSNPIPPLSIMKELRITPKVSTILDDRDKWIGKISIKGRIYKNNPINQDTTGNILQKFLYYDYTIEYLEDYQLLYCQCSNEFKTNKGEVGQINNYTQYKTKTADTIKINKYSIRIINPFSKDSVHNYEGMLNLGEIKLINKEQLDTVVINAQFKVKGIIEKE